MKKMTIIILIFLLLIFSIFADEIKIKNSKSKLYFDKDIKSIILMDLPLGAVLNGCLNENWYKTRIPDKNGIAIEGFILKNDVLVLNVECDQEKMMENYNIGIACCSTGDYTHAETSFEKMLQIVEEYKRKGGTFDREALDYILTSIVNSGKIYAQSNQDDALLRIYTQGEFYTKKMLAFADVLDLSDSAFISFYRYYTSFSCYHKSNDLKADSLQHILEKTPDNKQIKLLLEKFK